MVLIAMLAAKLMSPVLIVMGLLAGWFSTKWWHVIVGAVVAAILDEAFLHSMQMTRNLDVGVILLAFLAAAIWEFVVFAIRRRRASNIP